VAKRKNLLRLPNLAERPRAKPFRRTKQKHTSQMRRRRDAGRDHLGRGPDNDCEHNPALLVSLPELIDQETGVPEILEILQSIIAQAGDLIESRSPELVAAARAALARYHDEALGQAE
jgi:hypothetical protein